MSVRLQIVGNSGGTNVGEAFRRAGAERGYEVNLIEAHRAMAAPRWLRTSNWRLRGHRPTRLRAFGRQVVNLCTEQRAGVLVATGIAPLSAKTLATLRPQGVKLLNYLTDDPWNPAHRAPWFLDALHLYDWVFSPRKANLNDLRNVGCRNVRYLPFAYSPHIHHRLDSLPASGANATADVVFIGGADTDRIPYCEALLGAGFVLALYGDYWDRYSALRRSYRGYAGAGQLPCITGNAKVSLCMVRKANRDGHTMRTYEAAAMGGCLLVEKTEDHEELFGPEGSAVLYFTGIAEMIEKVRWLVDHEEERTRLAENSHALITSGANTYADRLETILQAVCAA